MSENISEKKIEEVVSEISFRISNEKNFKVIRLGSIYLVCAHRVYAEDMEILNRCLGCNCNLEGYSIRLEDGYVVISSSDADSTAKMTYDEVISFLISNPHAFHIVESADTGYDEYAMYRLDSVITGPTEGNVPAASSSATAIIHEYPNAIVTELKKMVSNSVELSQPYGSNALKLFGYSENAYSKAMMKAVEKSETDNLRSKLITKLPEKESSVTV